MQIYCERCEISRPDYRWLPHAHLKTLPQSLEGEIPLNANAATTFDGGRVAIVSGFWDGTIRAYAGDEPCGEIAASKGHRDIVDCIAMDLLPHPSAVEVRFCHGWRTHIFWRSISAVQHRVFTPNANKSNVRYGYLVSVGGADASVGVWEIVSTLRMGSITGFCPLQKFGHSDAIVSVAVNASLDIVVRVTDGTCLCTT